MNCLLDLIGVRGCPSSGTGPVHFVNDLEGFTMRSLQDAADDERKTFLGVWNKVQTRALKRFSVELIAAFNARYQLKSINRAIDLRRRINQAVTTAPAALHRGFTIQLNLHRDARLVSVLQRISFSSLTIYLDAVPTNPLVINVYKLDDYDAAGNQNMEELDSLTVQPSSLTTGFNMLTFERSYEAQRLAVVYDATEITGTYQSVPQYAVDSFVSCAGQMYGPSCGGWIRGIEKANLTESGSYTEGANTFGLSAVFSLTCKFDNLVCNNRDVFSYALWQLMGAELMYSLRHSEEMNRFNTIDAKEAEVLMSDYNAEFIRSLKQACDGISLDTADACVKCNFPIRTTEYHP